MSAPNFYELLQVDRRAGEHVIRAAYRAEMEKIHPDTSKHPGDAARAQALGEARQTLLDPAARRKYDATLQDQARAAQDEARHHAQEQEHQAETYETERPRRARPRRARRAAPARPPRAPRERYEDPREPNPLLDFGAGLIQAGLRGTTRRIAPLVEQRAEEAGEAIGQRLIDLLSGGSK